MSSAARILVVDDEAPNRMGLERILRRERYQVLQASDGNGALQRMRAEPVDLVLSDLRMPGLDGMQLLKAVRAEFPDVEFLLLTAYGSVELAVQAMRDGAYDFITKPIKRHDVLRSVRKALEKRELVAENRALRARLEGSDDPLSRIIGTSAAMAQVLSLVRQVAPANSPVLITGASGTGKERIADAIHALSSRSTAPMVRLACAALPESLLESELFGHERGAFTGAVKGRAGRFEQANGGTLFLDEVGEMSAATQVKLLRVLQEGTFERLGSNRSITTDVRILAATNQDLAEAVRDGSFREDLYYRLNVIHIALPPLRDRLDDVPQLAAHFARRSANKNDKPTPSMDKEFLDGLLSHDWPGNVRELENAIERAVVLGGDVLRPDLLPPSLGGPTTAPRLIFDVGTPLKEIERRALEATLRFTGGDKKAAANMLGIGERTIYRRLEEPRETDEGT
jgi:two-component system response regulator HydG